MRGLWPSLFATFLVCAARSRDYSDVRMELEKLVEVQDWGDVQTSTLERLHQSTEDVVQFANLLRSVAMASSLKHPETELRISEWIFFFLAKRANPKDFTIVTDFALPYRRVGAWSRCEEILESARSDHAVAVSSALLSGFCRQQGELVSSNTITQRHAPPDWFISPEYQVRSQATSQVSSREIADHPDVTQGAFQLAAAFNRPVLFFGCDLLARNSVPAALNVLVLDTKDRLDRCQLALSSEQIIVWKKGALAPIAADTIRNLVVVSYGVIERVADVDNALRVLDQLASHGAIVLLATLDRERSAHGFPDRYTSTGPPSEPTFLREWAMLELKRLLAWAGITPAFVGFTRTITENTATTSNLIMLTELRPTLNVGSLNALQVLVVLVCQNNRGVVEEAVRILQRQSVRVHVLDVASTDGSWDKIDLMRRGGEITAERVESPLEPNDPSLYRQWRANNHHLAFDWVLWHAVDEVVVSPWSENQIRTPNPPLLDALSLVGDAGFTAIQATFVIHSTLLPYADNNTLRRPPSLARLSCQSLTATPTLNGLAILGWKPAATHHRVFPLNFAVHRYPQQPEHLVQVEDEPKIPQRHGCESQWFSFDANFLHHTLVPRLFGPASPRLQRLGEPNLPKRRRRLFLVVAIYNRGHFLLKLLRNLADIAATDSRWEISVRLVDFNSTDVDFEEARRSFPSVKLHVIPLALPFLFGLALQRGADSVVQLQRDEHGDISPDDVLLITDVDTRYPLTLFSRLERSVQVGATFWAPIYSWERKDGSVNPPCNDHRGCGNMAMSVGDFRRTDGWNGPILYKKTHGYHDTYLVLALKKLGLRAIRQIEPDVVSLWHERSSKSEWYSDQAVSDVENDRESRASTCTFSKEFPYY